MGTRTSDGSTTEPVVVPADLDSPRSKLVYLSLSAWGAATADELCDRLGLDKGTVLVITKTLRERGYLERQDGQYRLA